MPVPSGFTVKVKVNSLHPVEADHSPGVGSAGAGGVDVGIGGAGVVASGGSAGAGIHPTKIILTTITTVNKGMINCFILASFLNPPIFWS